MTGPWALVHTDVYISRVRGCRRVRAEGDMTSSHPVRGRATFLCRQRGSAWRLRNDVFILLQTLFELTVPVTNGVGIVLGLWILALFVALSVGAGGADRALASAFLGCDVVSYSRDPLGPVRAKYQTFFFFLYPTRKVSLITDQDG